MFKIICNSIFPFFLTLGYWALLYKTTWAHGLAIASIVYFGLCLIGQAILAAFGFVGLCCAGFVIAFGDQSISASIIIILAIIVVLLIITFQIGISLAGLLLSIDLLHSGGQTCPVSGVDCRWLIVLFFLTMVFGALRGTSPKQKVILPTNYETVETTNDGPETTRVTEVSQSGYVTTTTQTTQGGQTQTTTVTHPLNENGSHMPGPKTIISSFLFSPQTSLNLRSTQSTNQTIDVERGTSSQH